MSQFAADNPDINVIAMGASIGPADNVIEALTFSVQYGLDLSKLDAIYDPSGKSLAPYAVNSTPTWLVFGENAEPVVRGVGQLDGALVLEKLAEAAAESGS